MTESSMRDEFRASSDFAYAEARRARLRAAGFTPVGDGDKGVRMTQNGKAAVSDAPSSSAFLDPEAARLRFAEEREQRVQKLVEDHRWMVDMMVAHHEEQREKSRQRVSAIMQEAVGPTIVGEGPVAVGSHVQLRRKGGQLVGVLAVFLAAVAVGLGLQKADRRSGRSVQISRRRRHEVSEG